MKIKKTFVIFGLLSVFTNTFGAELSDGVKSQLPHATGFEADDGISRGALENSSYRRESVDNVPLNVILMLVDGLYRSDVTAYLKNKDAFPVHGLLKTCLEAGNCHCDEKLGSSVAALLSWAQHVKGMSTSAIYAMSDSISGPRGRLIDRRRPETSRIFRNETAITKEERNIPAQTKDALFHYLMNGLNPTQLSNAAELTSSVLEELISTPNEFGHLVVVRIGVNEFYNVFEQLKHHVALPSTLTVVMNSCVQDRRNSLPFFAGGLGSERLPLTESMGIVDLPLAIRTIIGKIRYQADVNVKNVRPTLVFIPDKLPTRNIKRSTHDDIKKKQLRLKRDEAKKPEQTPDVKPDEPKSPEPSTPNNKTELAGQPKEKEEELYKLEKNEAEFEEVVVEPYQSKNSTKEDKKGGDKEGNGGEVPNQSLTIIIIAITATVSYASNF